METKFTKGSWSHFKCVDDVGGLFFTVESKLECGESRFICDTAEHITSDTDDAAPSASECESNYNLIAAAPEMYEMLEYNRKGWVNLIDLDLIKANYEKDVYMLIDKIEGLLAKARGEL